MGCKLGGKNVVYLGESSRSLEERSREHVGDSQDLKKNSHMRHHWEEEHDGTKSEFKFSVIKKCTSSFQREVGEAVLIKTWSQKRNVDLLNSKEEFCRNVLPEISMKKGQRIIEDEEDWDQENKTKKKS